MTIHKNNLDVTLTTEQSAAVTASIASLYTAMPFLVSMSAADRRRLPKLGDKSESFVRQAHQIVRDHGSVLPTGLDLAAMDRDATIRDLLLPVHQQLSQILSLVDDTIMAAGCDLMKASLIVYRALQSHGEEAGLRLVRDELGRRFAKTSTTPEEEEEAPAAANALVSTTGGEGAGAEL